MVQAYDVKARRKVEMKNPHIEVTKNNRLRLAGISAVTGNKVGVFVNKEVAAKYGYRATATKTKAVAKKVAPKPKKTVFMDDEIESEPESD